MYLVGGVPGPGGDLVLGGSRGDLVPGGYLVRGGYLVPEGCVVGGVPGSGGVAGQVLPPCEQNE